MNKKYIIGYPNRIILANKYFNEDLIVAKKYLVYYNRWVILAEARYDYGDSLDYLLKKYTNTHNNVDLIIFHMINNYKKKINKRL